jgi:membrane-bound lytic murein transglycosylase D
MAWARSFAAIVSLGLGVAHARAEVPPPAPMVAGPQDQQPTAPPTVRAPLVANPAERQAVRGCPVGATCRPWRDELREFEREVFTRGAGPWVDAPGPKRAATPAELRPDLPWLADLRMPDLPVTWDRRVIDYLVFYKDDPRGRRIMRGWLERSGRYRDLIIGALRKAHLPEDLFYVCMIESSFDSSEVSRVGASGLWQFMPDGGRIYGLAIDRWVDERNDPVRATEAAMGFWTDLHHRFGDWDLAMAAYNAGYGAVLKGIARFNTNDFWALLDYENALPWESGIYVPKALAAAIVGHNLEVFGFADVERGAPEVWDDVTVPSSVPLTSVAKAAGATVDQIKRLNPHLRRNRTPAGKSFVVRVPAGAGPTFAARLGQERGNWDNVDTYVARYGERFEDIATLFGVSRAKLRALNDLDRDSDVTGGTVLLVPRITAAERAKNLAAAEADLYGSGVDHRPGEPLIVAVPDKDAEVADRRRVFYRVVAGDELGPIARALGVPVAELATWNGLAVDATLHPRMVLQAFVAPAWSADANHVALLDDRRLVIVTRGSKEHLELSEGRSGRERVEYVATRRESYEQLGKRFGLGKRDLARINRKPPDTVVDKGDVVVVYRVVDKTRSERAEKQWKQLPKSQRKGKGQKPAAGGRKVSDGGDAVEADDAAGEEEAVAVVEKDAKDAPKTAAKDAKDAKDAPKTAAKDAKDVKDVKDAPKTAAKDVKDAPKTAAKDAKDAKDAPKATEKDAKPAPKAAAKDDKDTSSPGGGGGASPPPAPGPTAVVEALDGPATMPE